MISQTPSSLSVVIITCNAGTSLDRCLSSVQSIASEIVIVDSGSHDDTADIAARYHARFISQPWLGFGPQKQFAVNLARFDWILSLDADEWLTPELSESIRHSLQSPDYYTWRIARRNCFLGRFLAHGEGYPDRILRLFHRQYARWSDDLVHEKILTEHPIGMLTGDLMHDSCETLEQYLAKQNRYTTLQAETLAKSGRSISPLKPVFSAGFRFIRGYIFKLGFLDGFAGLVHMLISAANTFFKYAKAIELSKKRKLTVKQQTH